MPVQFLTDEESHKLISFPAEISHDDLIKHFTLSPKERSFIQAFRDNRNRLGFALHLCSLRYLGYFPALITSVPDAVSTYVAKQLKVSVNSLAHYSDRPNTRSDHERKIMSFLRFRKFTAQASASVAKWLT
jgi:TnpA family transposase